VPELELSAAYVEAAPVIVTSPTTRCGTTLVQRVLCASDNAIVYGEEIGRQFQTLTALFASQIRHNEHRAQTPDEDFVRAISGVLTDWRPGLAPPPQVLLRAWTDTYFQLPVALASFGAGIGRPIWGFKWPACPIELVTAYLTLMPKAKIVYVMRNLVEALMSAKARRFVNNPADVESFCLQWAKNAEAALSLHTDGRVLVLPYERLMERRDEQVRALGAFTGAKGLRLEAFDVKVNTYRGEKAHGHSPTQYIDPIPLTDDELATVFDKAAGPMKAYYPRMRAQDWAAASKAEPL
jgi:hypothetical protein